MPKAKRTITRDSVFRGTGSATPSTTPPTQGVTPSASTTPPTQGVTPSASPTRQTAVWLADEEVEWLDGQIRDVKRSGWRNLTRSALIRALIRAAMEQSPNLGGVSGEQELIQRLLAKEWYCDIEEL